MSLLKYLKARLEPIFRSDSEFVDTAFRDILGRDADQGGLEFYRGVLRWLNGGDPSPPVDPGDALRVLEVLDAARRSASEGSLVALPGK